MSGVGESYSPRFISDLESVFGSWFHPPKAPDRGVSLAKCEEINNVLEKWSRKDLEHVWHDLFDMMSQSRTIPAELVDAIEWLEESILQTKDLFYTNREGKRVTDIKVVSPWSHYYNVTSLQTKNREDPEITNRFNTFVSKHQIPEHPLHSNSQFGNLFYDLPCFLSLFC